MSFKKEPIKLLKELLTLIRSQVVKYDKHGRVFYKYKQIHGYLYLTSMFNKNKICSPQRRTELYYIGETYVCLLKSTRDWKILYEKYNGNSEEDYKRFADKVGFKLPNTST